MNRLTRTDAALNALNEERDHLAIQISLLDDGATPDPDRLAALRRKLETLEQRISHYRPAEA
jgi:predicted nuclease with TOPRIM domain